MKARLIIAVIIIGALGLASLFLFLKFREVTEPLTSASADTLVAGPSFEPGSEGRLHGTETEAFLDGLQQKIRAVDPSQEWRDAFPTATCTGEGVETCEVEAPKALPGAPETSPEQAAEGLGAVLKNLIPVEALPLLLPVGLLMIVLWEDNS